MMRSTQVNVPPGMIDLGVGQPGFDLLPLELLRRAAAQRLAIDDRGFLNYGYEQGGDDFRLALADFLQRHYRQPVAAESLMTTAGTSQALDLVCTCFTRPGDTIFVEEPTYFLALRIFADRGLNIVSVPTDEDGLQIDALAGLLAEQRPAFLYTIPTFHNPTGITLSARRRERLLALSREYDFLIVADEVYQLLYYAKEPPPSLATLPGSESVLSLGTFSKILAPGIRLGWIHTSPSLLDPLLASGLLASGGGLNPFTSAIVQVALAEGWVDTHLSQLQTTYGSRLAAMATALSAEMGETGEFLTPSGGFFFWLTLPEGVTATVLREMARRHQVDYRPGALFSAADGSHRSLRLCFAYYDETKISEGVKRLGNALRAFPTSTKSTLR